MQAIFSLLVSCGMHEATMPKIKCQSRIQFVYCFGRFITFKHQNELHRISEECALKCNRWSDSADNREW